MHTLTNNEWAVLADFQVILEVRTSQNYPWRRTLTDIVHQVPHHVQQVMSGEATPILSGAIPSFEMFMTKWEVLAEKHPRLEQWIRTGLEWATSYYARMDRTQSYVVAMRKSIDLQMLLSRSDADPSRLLVLNPTIRMKWIRQHWDPDYIVDAEHKIKALVSYTDFYLLKIHMSCIRWPNIVSEPRLERE